MNDIEDLLRDELRARVARAEGDEAPGQPAALLPALERRITRARLRRRLDASLLGAVAIAAAIALPLALLSPGAVVNPHVVPTRPRGSLPLSDPSLTPAGWSPLTYRDGQVSVPSSWVVQGPLGSVCRVTTHGGVLLGQRLRPAELNDSSCRLPPTTVFLSAAPFSPRPVMRMRLNGIPVARLPSPAGWVSYIAPSLGVEVTVGGPKARLVLQTLTRSPRSVVLARGATPPVPAGWRWHHFGGIRFAAPGGWKAERTDKWGSCDGRPVLGGIVQLSRARISACPTVGFLPSLAGSFAPAAGITVGAGRLVTADTATGSYQRCMRLHGMRACIQDGPSAGELLALVVYPPGRPAPTAIYIGLAGSGATARTIFNSIQPGD